MSKRWKYPRTNHFPMSPGADKSDKVMENTDAFGSPRPPCKTNEKKDVVVTLKMDGENTTLYHDYWHARSMSQNQHLSRNWIAAFHAQIQHLIPPEIRICGENLYARHSIHYKNLNAYFQVFGIWEGERCWAWEDVKQFCLDLKVETVPVVSEGKWQGETAMYWMFDSYLGSGYEGDEVEGLVVRIADEIPLDKWPTSVGKFVRKNHITTDQHWMTKPVVKNSLKIINNLQKIKE